MTNGSQPEFVAQASGSQRLGRSSTTQTKSAVGCDLVMGAIYKVISQSQIFPAFYRIDKPAGAQVVPGWATLFVADAEREAY